MPSRYSPAPDTRAAEAAAAEARAQRLGLTGTEAMKLRPPTAAAIRSRLRSIERELHYLHAEHKLLCAQLHPDETARRTA